MNAYPSDNWQASLLQPIENTKYSFILMKY